MANNFQNLLNAQDRTGPVPETHAALQLDSFIIKRESDTPLTDLREEWNKIENLERISWIEDQGWEYEIFLKNYLDINCEEYVVKMFVMLSKEAATAYSLRWQI
jgi:hypothetical protein